MVWSAAVGVFHADIRQHYAHAKLEKCADVARHEKILQYRQKSAALYFVVQSLTGTVIMRASYPCRWLGLFDILCSSMQPLLDLRVQRDATGTYGTGVCPLTVLTTGSVCRAALDASSSHTGSYLTVLSNEDVYQADSALDISLPDIDPLVLHWCA